MLYRISKGGVTLSGGEPASQAEFTSQFFKMCREKGIHTALDTCGYADWKVIENILPYVDVVLCDLKHMDPLKHEALTGVSNKLILENVRNISLFAKVPLVIRMPVIPGYNDSEKNIKDTAQFMKEVEIKEINLLPYHRMGTEKYNKLDKKYQLGDVLPPTDERLSSMKDFFESYGLSCIHY